jgi:hypothetical protein
MPKGKNATWIDSRYLYDVNENKEYGTFSWATNINRLVQCNVLDKFCTSEDEWNLLIKPYMEE